MMREVLILVAVLLIFSALVALVVNAPRRRKVEEREAFGDDEYERTRTRARSSTGAVSDMAERRRLRGEMQEREPTGQERRELGRALAGVERQVREAPAAALLAAKRLSELVMLARGYPGRSRELALRLLSVDHPDEAIALRAVVEQRVDRELHRHVDVVDGFVAASRRLLHLEDGRGGRGEAGS